MDQWAKSFVEKFRFSITSLASLLKQILTHISLQATTAAFRMTNASAAAGTSTFSLKRYTPQTIPSKLLATTATVATLCRIAASVLILIIPTRGFTQLKRQGSHEVGKANRPPIITTNSSNLLNKTQTLSSKMKGKLSKTSLLCIFQMRSKARQAKRKSFYWSFEWTGKNILGSIKHPKKSITLLKSRSSHQIHHEEANHKVLATWKKKNM